MDEKNKRNRKGYLMAVLAIFVIIMLYYYYSEINKIKLDINSRNLKLISIEKLGYYVDDIIDDIRNVIAVDNQGNLTIVENLSINKSKFFSDYTNFVPNYFNSTGVIFAFNYSDPITVNYFDANYYSYFNGSILFVNDSQAESRLPFSFYEIIVRANESYTGYDEWNWQTTGTYVRINYSDKSNSFIKEGYINPAVANAFKIYYPSGTVAINTGMIGTYGNSFALYQNGQITYFKLMAYPSSQSDLYFNIKVNMSILGTNYSSSIPVR
jgi:hypothetical protein